MLISESMANRLPVIAFQADGTEFDLIIDGNTGIRMKRGDASEVGEAISSLRARKLDLPRMGEESARFVRERFTTKAMVEQIFEALKFAWMKRRKSRLPL